MQRRKLLATGTSIGAGVVGGCLEWGGESDYERDETVGETVDLDASVPPLDVSAEDVSPRDTDVTLDVRYDHQTSPGFEQTGGPNRYAEVGDMWVFVEMAVRMAGDAQRWLRTHQYVLVTDQEPLHPGTPPEDDLRGTVPPSDGWATGWLAYLVSQNLGEAILTVDNDVKSETYSVTFEHDPSLDTAYPP